MTGNPYESPSLESQPDIQAEDITVSRPMGISILAVLLFVEGVLLFGMQFLLFAHLQVMEDSLRPVGIVPATLIFGIMFLAMLGIASAIGMWKGTRWGWWLGVFYHVYAVFRNSDTLVSMVMLVEQLESVIPSTEYYMIKHVGRIVIHSALLLYFFKRNVLAFFGLRSLPRIQAIVILVGICVAIIAATRVIGVPWHVTQW